MKDSITVVIPAFNEEENIEKSVEVVSKTVGSVVEDYEILIVNDGSKDNTGVIAQKLTQQDKRVRLITHKTNLGMGATLLDGFRNAGKTYITGYPADVDMSIKSFKELLLARGKAEMVSSYMTNFSDRTPARRVISILFIKVMNFIFRLNLRYYNGYFICRKTLLDNLKIKSKGFTISAEIKIRLIKNGVSFTDIPFKHVPRVFGVSKALTVKNILQTIYIILVLIKDIYLTPKK